MKIFALAFRLPVFALTLFLAGAGTTVLGSAAAQDRRQFEVAATVAEERVVGPYNVHVLAGGPALERPVPVRSRVLTAEGAYTLSLWLDLSASLPPQVLLAGVGDLAAENSRFLGVDAGHLMLRYGVGNLLIARSTLPSSGMHFLAAVSDGQHISLSVDGREVAQDSLAAADVAPRLILAPVAMVPDLKLEHFGGNLIQVTLAPYATPAARLVEQSRHLPDLAALRFSESSLPWPVQTRAQAGYQEPQDPSLMPSSRAAFSATYAKPLPPAGAPALLPIGSDEWALRSHWKLLPAPQLTASGGAISQVGFVDRAWLQATVPGTVLTTMVDRGIYPDPDFGLNNLAIPESLNKQDYWYRIEFQTPREAAGKLAALQFLGINYAAEVWLNGSRVGDLRGAFLRGNFNVTSLLKPAGLNALAVRISPPPHPGIPQEQSILGGPGENGGALCLDGPTFVATEGWDWIPAVRDRNSGIWQDVLLSLTGSVEIGDPRVITRLPLPDLSSADVSIDVPLHNRSTQAMLTKLHVEFEGVSLDKTVTAPAGDSTVTLSSAEFSQLHVEHPRLWWPNGYGKPELYHLRLALSANAGQESHREVTFGIREITYRLSLFDSTGHLRRKEVAPVLSPGGPLIDVRHDAMRQTAEYWAPALTSAGEHSVGVTDVNDEPGFTDLVIKVNGVRIAARGGNWGMDDSRKRVSREHLEPFFRLHRDANVNIIRNWVGQNTEETFFQLADEYGLMVWNDFWASTQDYNVEPQDVPLFLENARDVVRRFRNHPSIVIWCGRNEGVPQPILNEGLIAIFAQEDGTRYYTPGSNRIDLRNSGPYQYQDPTLYYTTLDKGFSVELGISSLSTLESLQASMAPEDQWPISDAWAYHDWHQSGNGDVHPLLHHMETQFGAATSLPDFERKAQMFNYVDHRAIFEGFNQHLFQPNSGRLLWMTQPAWPSNSWQILSSDYDTQASFYGVKKACEPLHLQLDLSDFEVTGINTTGSGASGLQATATVYDLAGRQLFTQQQVLELPSNKAVPLFKLALAPYFDRHRPVLVLLQMRDASGTVVSRNVYWLAGQETDYRDLNRMPPAQIQVRTALHEAAGEQELAVTLSNTSNVPALAVKMVLSDAATHERILPAFYSDNYVSLLPGETLNFTVHYPTPAVGQRLTPELTLRGWNLPASVQQARR